ncbi:adenosylcobinamide kinase/adenosylcobinamide-phosphate guanylyltransferase [Oikeobacillus pervagus]|uniref:Adenosylcobinamide kinase n=1 Tax=Oikeobacillus pervagus TaxID=1325931 RepID=A0AAJ1WKB5_9BACI|nr:bifunctional adenosylcobinamide kinase/adenosylcobinamide-phosphate guanylyltransferase [Oikeobacillus pervagus]MDQ0216418.1 adenosylcobinamide kinase/adenosylcobinamide-phosphate guanylyltransferase [Oikeobacillus pervagus]
MEKSTLIFVTGGVRSGKSTFAEKYAQLRAKKKQGKLHYIACGQVIDEEMARRVQLHQIQRKTAEIPWITWEQPINIDTIAHNFSKKDTIVLDCLTTWLTNEWFLDEENEEKWEEPDFHHELFNKITSGISKITETCAELIIVSNELAHEDMTISSLNFYYAKTLGKLHQWIVKNASQAYSVENGIWIAMKKEVGSK